MYTTRLTVFVYFSSVGLAFEGRGIFIMSMMLTTLSQSHTSNRHLQHPTRLRRCQRYHPSQRASRFRHTVSSGPSSMRTPPDSETTLPAPQPVAFGENKNYTLSALLLFCIYYDRRWIALLGFIDIYLYLLYTSLFTSFY